MPGEYMTVAEVRAAEDRAMESVPESTLMARAADAVTAECEALLLSRVGRLRDVPVVVLAGSGKNGGDAMLAGARLHYRGAQVTVLLVSSSAHGMGVGECRAAGAAVVDAQEDLAAARAALADARLVIDGIVGLGASPGLREPAGTLVSSIPDAAAVVAVDIPSGLDADSPRADAAHVSADVTVTFTAPKRCLVEDPASSAAGRIVVASVGVPRDVARMEQ